MQTIRLTFPGRNKKDIICITICCRHARFSVTRLDLGLKKENIETKKIYIRGMNDSMIVLVIVAASILDYHGIVVL